MRGGRKRDHFKGGFGREVFAGLARGRARRVWEVFAKRYHGGPSCAVRFRGLFVLGKSTMRCSGLSAPQSQGSPRLPP